MELVGQVGHGPCWPSACRGTSSRLDHTAQVEDLHDLGYSDRELDEWAGKINSWTQAAQDVYVYCDNDMKVRAPYDAMGLMKRLGVQPSPR